MDASNITYLKDCAIVADRLIGNLSYMLRFLWIQEYQFNLQLLVAVVSTAAVHLNYN